MAVQRWLIFFTAYFLFVNCELTVEHNLDNLNELYHNDILAVLDYLNSSPVKVYNYKRGDLINAHKKADITELTLDVSVDCINNYPQLPCSENTLTCNAFVRYTPEKGSKVLGDVKCKPKIEIVIDDVDADSSYTTISSLTDNQELNESVVLSHEAVSTASGEQFVAIRKDSVPCPGCPFDLNPEIEGVNELVETALHHVESERNQKHVAVKVLRIQQQIVAGVKYILLLEVAPTTCPKDVVDINLELCPLDSSADTLTCRVVYLQQPWISKNKQIISNNCTISQEYNTLGGKIRNDMDNEIEVNYGNIKPFPGDKTPIVDNPNFDDIAESGVIDDDDTMTADRLADLESQIIPNPEPIQQQQQPPVVLLTPQFQVNEEIIPTPIIEINQVTKAIVPDLNTAEVIEEKIVALNEPPQPGFDEFVVLFDQPQADDNKSSSEENAKLKNCSSNRSEENKSSSSSSEESNEKLQKKSSSSSSEESKENVTTTEQSQKLVSNSSESSDSSSSEEEENQRPKRSIGELEKITAEEKPLVKDLADFAASTLDNIDDDNHKRVVLQILGAKKLISDGIYYHLILRLGISHCLEDKQIVANENCREKLFENFTKICKVQVHVTNDFNNPKIVKSQCQNIKRDKNDNNRSNYSRYKRQVLAGGQNEISKDDPRITKFLFKSLNHLDSQSDSDKKYKVIKIHSATSQVVAGAKYRIKAEISLSDCSKNDNKDLEKCNQLQGTPTRICEIEVWDRPWLPRTETTIKCNDNEKKYKFESTERSKRGLLGGTVEQAPDNLDALNYVKGSLLYLDSKSEHNNKYKIHEIVSASKQLVSGSLWRIKAKIVLSDCSKNEAKDSDQCNQLQGAEPKLCNFKVWDQPWLPQGRETNITCENDQQTHSYRSKRDLIKHHNYLHLSNKNDHDLYFALFKEFMNAHNKTYISKSEYKYRLKVFIKNLNYIRLLNKYEQGTAKYGITQFTDLTRTEFSRSRGLRPDLYNENDVAFTEAVIPDIELPTEFDWRKQNTVTEVKNQGQCGSCWAFSVTGNIEGQYAIKYKKLLEFSEQELVDCDKVDEGCSGGLMDNAYRVIEQLGGLETETDYPYDAEDEKCNFKKTLARVQLKGAVNISQIETDMAKWLVKNGPISIAINANAMQFYVGGVSHPYKFLCSPTNLDHGVLIVGYGVHTYPLFKKSLPYWIVKNSWGRSWGEQGYYRVYRGDGTCGLNQTPSSAIVA